MGKEFGDYQTPPGLVSRVLSRIGMGGRRWSRVLEPTCGTGGFIRGLLDSPAPPDEIVGIEIQDAHLIQARRFESAKARTRVRIMQANLFELDLARDLSWRAKGPLLVIGNPPWVTNSTLGAIGSRNLPVKSNLKGLSGINALTGASNFDLAESIWLKLIRELRDERPAIVLLCKTIVARNVLQYLRERSIPFSSAWIRRLDARRYFKASVDACLFYLEIGGSELTFEVPVFSDFESSMPESVLGFVGGRILSDISRYRRAASIDGTCPFVWRQGIKHDAARVMELRREGEQLINGLGEPVDVESDYLFPLFKSSDLNRKPHIQPILRVIVPQRRIGDDTTRLRTEAPKLWKYLSMHSFHFERRKSSIYKGRPPFSIFGIGDYSFSPFKVAVSGFGRVPRFRLIWPAGGRPVMLDDTCYFIACESSRQAALLAALLIHRHTADFLQAIIFADSKRPLTKRLLQRIDLIELLNRVGREEILSEADRLLLRLHKDATKEHRGWPEDLRILLRPPASRE
ncbi:MAG TPA: class I SAM-dependent methyltransferase [Blastocatellia bacterium]|nr:class I SAM-dependent methyltransferase [Blastocatellia bacterium]